MRFLSFCSSLVIIWTGLDPLAVTASIIPRGHDAPPWLHRAFRSPVDADEHSAATTGAKTKSPFMKLLWEPSESPSRRRFQWRMSENQQHQTAEANSTEGANEVKQSPSIKSVSSLEAISKSMKSAGAVLKRPKGNATPEKPKSDGASRIWPSSAAVWFSKTKGDEEELMSKQDSTTGIRILQLEDSQTETAAPKREKNSTATSPRLDGGVHGAVPSPFESLGRWQQTWSPNHESGRSTDKEGLGHSVKGKNMSKEQQSDDGGVQILRLLRSKHGGDDSGLSVPVTDTGRKRQSDQKEANKTAASEEQTQERRAFGLSRLKGEVSREKKDGESRKGNGSDKSAPSRRPSWLPGKPIESKEPPKEEQSDRTQKKRKRQPLQSGEKSGSELEKKRGPGFSLDIFRHTVKKNESSSNSTDERSERNSSTARGSKRENPESANKKDDAPETGSETEEKRRPNFSFGMPQENEEKNTTTDASEKSPSDTDTSTDTKPWWQTSKSKSEEEMGSETLTLHQKEDDGPGSDTVTKSYILDLDSEEITDDSGQQELEPEPLAVEKLETPEKDAVKNQKAVNAEKPMSGRLTPPTEPERTDNVIRNGTLSEASTPVAPAVVNNATVPAISPSTGSPPVGYLVPSQPHAPSMIVVGGPPEGHSRGSMPPGARRHVHPTATGTILIEALASIVTAGLRIWFLTTLTKWWSEEESMKPIQHFVWEQLNDRYVKDEAALQTVLQSPPRGVSERRWKSHLNKERRRERKLASAQRTIERKHGHLLAEPIAPFERSVVVVELGGESLNIPHLEQVVTFILTQHRQKAFGSHNRTAKELEVVLLVESPGGVVQDFGLAAAQVERLSNEVGIATTVCVDKVAASGGYMIASQAEQLIAAPFAIVGSIGVIRESMNLHDALQKYAIKPLVLKAGKSKAPLTNIGPVTKQDLKTAQRTLNTMHKAFQNLVVRGRPMLIDSVDEVCNGDIYLGQDAQELRLVDRILTSEEYLLERIQAGDRVLKLHRSHQHHFAKHRRLLSPLDFIMDKGRVVRAALTKFCSSGAPDEFHAESTVAHLVTASSIVGFLNYLARSRGSPRS